MASDERGVLGLMAHPDDLEILCGGTLCLLKDAGWRVTMATMTAGDCGSATQAPDEISAMRRQEAANAAALIDADYHCLEELDVLVVFGAQTIRKAVELIRRARPEVVITHSPVDYMTDHEQASAIVRAATFGAPIRNFATGVEDPAPPTDSIPYLYYADPIEGTDHFGRKVDPTTYVDISSVIDRKAALLASHASQRDWLLRHHGIDEYLESMREWSRTRGGECGAAYAEGFRQHLGHAYPSEDVLDVLFGG